jgi:hypothetical protein
VGSGVYGRSNGTVGKYDANTGAAMNANFITEDGVVRLAISDLPPPREFSKDFNGDGYADLVWENTVTGERLIWLLKNGVYFSTISLPTPHPSWHIAGVGDFLSNGQRGLVLENAVTNQHVIWILNNGILQYGIELRPMSPGWHVAGAGDFNGDGYADLVLQNASLGQSGNLAAERGRLLFQHRPSHRLRSVADREPLKPPMGKIKAIPDHEY